MKTADKWFLIISLIVNLVFAVVYLIIHIKRRDRKRGFVNFLFFLVFPIVGALFTVCSFMLRGVIYVLKKQGLDMKELSFKKDRMKLLTDANIEKGLNTVPIEEALIVAEKKEKRSAFIDVLKNDDYSAMMGQIQKAVEHEDMEVAHYAATFVSESMGRFKVREAELRAQVDKDGTAEALCQYIAYMGDNLNPDIFGIVELKIYVELMDKAAGILYEQSPEMLNDHSITQVVELLDQINETDRIEPWIARSRGRFRDSLECFKLCARYYYKHGQRDKLIELLSEMKMYSVPLDGEALGWVRMLKLS